MVHLYANHKLFCVQKNGFTKVSVIMPGHEVLAGDGNVIRVVCKKKVEDMHTPQFSMRSKSWHSETVLPGTNYMVATQFGDKHIKVLSPSTRVALPRFVSVGADTISHLAIDQRYMLGFIQACKRAQKQNTLRIPLYSRKLVHFAKNRAIEFAVFQDEELANTSDLFYHIGSLDGSSEFSQEATSDDGVKHMFEQSLFSMMVVHPYDWLYFDIVSNVSNQPLTHQTLYHLELDTPDSGILVDGICIKQCI